MTEQSLQFGLTPAAACSYLSNQQEQLAVLLSPQPIDARMYQLLIKHNFRRSGDQLYRPHCANCSACQSLRIPIAEFKPGPGQRRLLNKAARHGWHYQLADVPVSIAERQQLFQLFADYIAFKHRDGVMYPASPEQLDSLLSSHWQTIKLLKLYQQQQLVAVMVVDELDTAYSAVYTFFSQHSEAFSPGKLAILYLLQLAALTKKEYLYLGYQVDGCRKMAYKQEFLPHQRYFAGRWHSFA
jgi:arginine-tRNA-protein transferase